MTGWTIAGLALLVLLYAAYLYNGLVTRRNRVGNAWSQIDVQLRRRHELVPNLVAAVKGYMTHERAVFEAVTRAREAALRAGDDVPARTAAEAELGRALRGLVAIAESTPELRASGNMLAFQEELSSTENRIALARQHYNDAVLDYNTALETVPSVFVARAFAFAPKTLFEGEEGQRGPVAVAF
jgi:LemA protein